MVAPSSFRSPDPVAIVFDMGGVLVELGPLADLLAADAPTPDAPTGDALVGDAPTGDAAEFWARWLASPTVRLFEMGGCDVEEFGASLVRELGLDIAGSEFVDRFTRWPRGLFPGAVDLIADLSRYEVAVLSNTNALHWEHQVDAPVISGLFDRTYLSFRLGLAKPDDAIFDHVIADLGVEPGRIVFLDDNLLNVDAARACGIDAHLARGVGEARAVLDGLGVFA